MNNSSKLGVFIAALAAIGAATYFLFPNITSDAPLIWAVRVSSYDGVRHFDQEAIYCAANVSAIWGSENRLSRHDRRSGTLIWGRHKKTDADSWYFERGHVFAGARCYLNSGYFDRKTSAIINPKVTAIDLKDGKVAWEVGAFGEAGGMTLSD